MINKYRVIILLVALMVFVVCVCIGECAIDLDVLALTESDGNMLAVSCAGVENGRGLYQISEIMLKDYNIVHKCDIKPYELFSTSINEKVAKWAINERIPHFLRHYGHSMTDYNVLQVYNLGIGAFNRGERNEKYVNRYKLKGGSA